MKPRKIFTSSDFSGPQKSDKERFLRILFLCKSNVTRSQMAEGFFSKLNKNQKIKAKSAALLQPQKIMHRLVVKVMAEKGIDISKNKSKKITKEMIEKADKIILMSSSLSEFLPQINKEKIETWNVNDVIANEDEKNLPKFREVRDVIEKKLKALIKNLI